MASIGHDLDSMQLRAATLTIAPARNVAAPRCRSLLARLTAVMLATTLAGAASAQSRLDDLFDDSSKTWTEIAVELPPMPAPANLLSFDVSTLTTQKFSIDANSLSVGSDGVVRYTLVAISASGARNISHEGIRCAANERKIYALGHADGTWSRARRDQWEPIVNNAVNRQQAALAQDYFCLGGGVAGKAPDMLRRVQRHEVLNQNLLR